MSEPSGMDPRVVELLDVLGSRVRTEILHLVARESMTALELAARMEVSHSQVHRHLVRLEDLGLVAADTALGRRRGRPVRWVAVAPRVDALAGRWVSYALGE